VGTAFAENVGTSGKAGANILNSLMTAITANEESKPTYAETGGSGVERVKVGFSNKSFNFINEADLDTPLCQTSCRLKKFNFEVWRRQWSYDIQKHLSNRRYSRYIRVASGR